MKKKNPLYIFFHIPKTAGSTFRFHVENNLAEHECLLFSKEKVGLDKSIWDYNYSTLHKAGMDFLNNLSSQMKKRIKIVYGHHIPFGIHKRFDRPARYFTFIREPVERTISLFNHKKNDYIEAIKKRKVPASVKKTYLVKDKEPSVSRWLKEKYNTDGSQRPTMLAVFTKLGYLRGKLNKRNINDLVKKFYFIGLTRNYDQDSLFLYHKLGFNRFYLNQNVSYKHVGLKEKRELKDEIEEKNKQDTKLYAALSKRNKMFKKNNQEYEQIVQKMKLKRTITLPFSQGVHSSHKAVRKYVKYILERLI